jgi:hypothetical protein
MSRVVNFVLADIPSPPRKQLVATALWIPARGIGPVLMGAVSLARIRSATSVLKVFEGLRM